ncbi:MAG: carboxypeptidase-like regulatory domain-containing protein [Flavobacteriaceae bacterium]|nr:carboxypeptidase-like regulatory domain-containing protein [Flavobacteriaceae bacterium]
MALLFYSYLVFSFSAFAQNGNITGKILDENGLSVPGAEVIIEPTRKGAISDFDGKFTIVNLPEGNYTILIKYLGFADTRQEVTVRANETEDMKIILISQSTELKEVVISSYGFSNQARAFKHAKKQTKHHQYCVD